MTQRGESSGETPHRKDAQQDTTLDGNATDVADYLSSVVTQDAFNEWHRERKHAQNIREGTPYFNGPTEIKEAKRHNPSDLLQCSRKITYKQLNAPEEKRDPEGIFWFGSRFEETVVLPFLEDIATDHGKYVTNSLWIDFETSTPAGDLRIKGSTDPVIVDENSEPILLFEIKTKRSIEDLTKPNDHHKAQAHAYMQGLSEKYNRSISEAVILYGSRTTLDIKPFKIEFDAGFWQDVVLDWATAHTTHRLDEHLPPANPEQEWECGFCSYKQRCGKGNRKYGNEGPTGLLSLFVEYPNEKLTQYLESYPEMKLTPSLAHQHPDLAAIHGAYDWRCEVCGSRYSWDEINWSGDITSPPPCPKCSDEGPRGLLAGPTPSEQLNTLDEATEGWSNGK